MTLRTVSPHQHDEGDAGVGNFEDEQPSTPRPPWARPEIPSGDDLLRSGTRDEVTPSTFADMDSEEVVQPKLLPSPVVPSKQEIAEHEVSHIPPRPWCPHCGAG